MINRRGEFAKLIWEAWIAFTFFFAMNTLPVFGDASPETTKDCGPCNAKVEQWVAIQQNEKKTIELLGKNKEYLAAIGAEQASKFLKVQSNIVQVLKKLDQLKVDRRVAEAELEKNGCMSCAEKNMEKNTEKKDPYEKSS